MTDASSGSDHYVELFMDTINDEFSSATDRAFAFFVRACVVPCAFAALACTAAAFAADQAPIKRATVEKRFCVSPAGNDTWTGTLPNPNRENTDGPFKTIGRAQRAVRAAKASPGPKASVRVEIRGGTYFLDAPLVFTDADSGIPEDAEWNKINAPEYPVVYAAFANEKPVLSGGRRISGWKTETVHGKTAWTTLLPDVQQGKWNFQQLFVNGARRMRPRLPKQGFFWIDGLIDARFTGAWEETVAHGADRFIYKADDLKPWHNLHDVQAVVVTLWMSLHMQIQSLDPVKRLVIFDRNSGTRMSDDFANKGAPYYVENVFEALVDPGEWYLDRPSGKLYYLPLPGETPQTAEVIAPCLTEVLRLEGASLAKSPVQCLRFEGLTFRHSEWFLPAGNASYHQGAFEAPGAVALRNARHCRFARCTFENLGASAVELVDACREIEIAGCTMRDLGAGAVKIRPACERNTVTDCRIHHGGKTYHGADAILIGDAGGNQVVHNEIHHFYHVGVSAGRVWGYGESKAYGNVIEYNHIHDIGQGFLSDLAGIYTLGPSPGTRIRYNRIHDLRRRGYGAFGIYLDDGTCSVLVENNLVYRSQSGGFHQTTGKDNVVRNNIFALNEELWIHRVLSELHPAATFEKNIVYFAKGTVLRDQEGGAWGPESTRFADNLYFDSSGRPLDFAGKTFAEWRKSGMDSGSIVADPLFVDLEHDNYRLKPQSPAFRVGFQEFDLSSVGPRGP